MSKQFKLIIGTEVPGCFGRKGIDTPKYFSTLDEVKAYYKKRKKEIEKDKQQIWFVKVWEFGKEDYIDLDVSFE